MSLSKLAIRFWRKPDNAAAAQPQPLAFGRRQSMTLESLNRAAQTRSLKPGMQAR